MLSIFKRKKPMKQPCKKVLVKKIVENEASQPKITNFLGYDKLRLIIFKKRKKKTRKIKLSRDREKLDILGKSSQGGESRLIPI